MTHGFNAQTDREIRYAHRQQKKMIEQHNIDRDIRAEKRGSDTSRLISTELSNEVRNEISILSQKRRLVPVRKSSSRESNSYFFS